MEYNFRNIGPGWQISKSTKVVPYMFALALTVSDILTFHIFYIQQVGQSHGVQFSQWRHSMADIKISKCRFLNFVFLLIIPRSWACNGECSLAKFKTISWNNKVALCCRAQPRSVVCGCHWTTELSVVRSQKESCRVVSCRQPGTIWMLYFASPAASEARLSG